MFEQIFKNSLLCILGLVIFSVGCGRDSMNAINVPKVGATYIMKFPGLEIGVYKDFKTDQLEVLRLKVIKDNKKLFLELIQPNKDYVLSSVLVKEKEQDKPAVFADNRLCISVTDNGNIHIEGYVYIVYGYGMYKINLTSNNFEQSEIFKGKGIMSIGLMGTIIEEYRDIFSINWVMFPDAIKLEEQSELYDVKLLREVPHGENPHRPTEEEQIAEANAKMELENRIRQYQPSVIKFYFRHAMQYPESIRIYSIFPDTGEIHRQRIIYTMNKILPDIDWEEINYLPESLITLDHVATIDDVTMSKYVWEGLHDKSGEIFFNQDAKKLIKIPLLFLLVYYNDWLTEKRVAELSKVSNRIKFIIEEVKKYGNDSPNKLDEIMISVLSKLSDQERRDYFVKSIKLRNYVKESNNLSLQKLMPNDLPPPPSPPENMRDWYNDEGKLYRGAFVRLEDDPDRGKVLILLDEDRIEVPLGFDDMSKETKRYITEMLEAQAEDAAESEKNKKQ
jgi:hypothetical protein